MSLNEAVEPVGLDAAVQEALMVLERAMTVAAARDGFVMQTMVLLWASEKDGDAYGGSLMKGDVGEEVIEFLTDLLQDTSGDEVGAESLARVQ